MRIAPRCKRPCSAWCYAISSRPRERARRRPRHTCRQDLNAKRPPSNPHAWRLKHRKMWAHSLKMAARPRWSGKRSPLPLPERSRSARMPGSRGRQRARRSRHPRTSRRPVRHPSLRRVPSRDHAPRVCRHPWHPRHRGAPPAGPPLCRIRAGPMRTIGPPSGFGRTPCPWPRRPQPRSHQPRWHQSGRHQSGRHQPRCRQPRWPPPRRRRPAPPRHRWSGRRSRERCRHECR